MDGLLECHICAQIYSATNCIPRMLPCGHTICNDCLNSIINTSRSCPDCRQVIYDTSATFFPVNFSILKAAESVTVSKATFHTSVSQIYEEFTRMEEKLLGFHFVTESNLEAVRSSKKTLDDFIQNWDERSSHEIKTTLDALKVQLSNTQKSLSFAVAKELTNVPVDSVTLKSEDFENHHNFLSEIYRQIQQGEKYIAILEVEKVVKKAKLSVWESRLKVHSFHPLYCVEPRTKVVCYRDLKRCFEETGKLTVFLEVNLFGTLKHHIFVELLETHFRSTFIKMCSGECAKSFKASPVCGFLDGRENKSLCWSYRWPLCLRSARVGTSSDDSETCIAKILFQFNLNKEIWDLHQYCLEQESFNERDSDTSRTHLVLLEGKFTFVKLKEKPTDTFIIGVVVCDETETNSTCKKEFVDTIRDCGISAYIN